MGTSPLQPDNKGFTTCPSPQNPSGGFATDFGSSLDRGDPAAVTQGCRGLRNRPGMVWETPPRSPAKRSRPGEPGGEQATAAADPSGRFPAAGENRLEPGLEPGMSLRPLAG